MEYEHSLHLLSYDYQAGSDKDSTRLSSSPPPPVDSPVHPRSTCKPPPPNKAASFVWSQVTPIRGLLPQGYTQIPLPLSLSVALSPSPSPFLWLSHPLCDIPSGCCSFTAKFLLPRLLNQKAFRRVTTQAGPHARPLPTSCPACRWAPAPLRGPVITMMCHALVPGFGRGQRSCCGGSLRPVSRCGRCSCWCRFRVRGAQ